MLNAEILAKLSEAELINIGSGPSAYAFNYPDAGVNGVNLAMTPSEFRMEIALLEEYGQYLKPGAAVIAAVCPFSFGENRDVGNPARFLRYYGVLSRASLERLPPPLAKWNAETAERADTEIPLFPYRNTVWDGSPSDEVMMARLEEMCACWRREFDLRDFIDEQQAASHLGAFRRKREALDALLALIRAYGLRPYLLLPPLHPLLRERISPAFFQAFVRDPLRDADAPLLDVSEDPLLTEQDFLGPVFLNRTGAAKLTRALYDRVRAL